MVSEHKSQGAWDLVSFLPVNMLYSLFLLDPNLMLCNIMGLEEIIPWVPPRRTAYGSMHNITQRTTMTHHFYITSWFMKKLSTTTSTQVV